MTPTSSWQYSRRSRKSDLELQNIQLGAITSCMCLVRGAVEADVVEVVVMVVVVVGRVVAVGEHGKVRGVALQRAALATPAGGAVGALL